MPVNSSSRPGPHTIRAWDHLVSRTRGSDVAQLSAWPAVRGHGRTSELART
ncbi:MAG: hypothetical protein M3228_01845 [Actinomycetota bacterium]|nr:hypothetical protein [Actinomycetota bacterium]